MTSSVMAFQMQTASTARFAGGAAEFAESSLAFANIAGDLQQACGHINSMKFGNKADRRQEAGQNSEVLSF